MVFPVVIGESGLDAVVIPFPDKMIEDLKFTRTSTEDKDLYNLVFVIPVSSFCDDLNLLEHRESVYRGMLSHLSDSIFNKFFEAAPPEYQLTHVTKLRLGKHFRIPKELIDDIAAKVVSLTKRDEPYDAFDENTFNALELGVALKIEISVKKERARRLLQVPLTMEDMVSISPKTKKGKKTFFGFFK